MKLTDLASQGAVFISKSPVRREIPWGEDTAEVFVRELSADEVDQLRGGNFKEHRVVALSIVDEEGNPLFSEDQAKALKPMLRVQLFTLAMDVFGLTHKAIDAEKKG